jgi:hypothetical protein
MFLASWFSRARRGALSLLLLIGTGLVLTACGGGGGGGSSSSDGTTTSETGTVVVGLTDAEGDFLTYKVSVESLTLTRANGVSVETLPLATPVDFAQYTEMTEFVSTATIPSGVYTAARIRLNYAGADIQVEDATGAAVAVTPLNVNGTPLTGTLELNVRLDPARPLVIAPGVPAHLTLDFNLKASNTVNLAAQPPTVTVEPFLIADVNHQAPKIHRVRGGLRSVNLANQTFDLLLRPFHRITGDFGAFTVAATSTTTFEIDQVAYDNTTGLAQLAQKPVGTATLALGEVNSTNRRFTAAEVYAGSSVAYGASDVVVGNVIARSGDNLTVRGATLIRADGSFLFRDNVTVTLATTTRVTKQLAPGQTFSKDDISVGQRLFLFGTYSAGTNTLDATNGLARMLLTTLTGTVNSTATQQLVMTLQTIDGRRLTLFNFAGTGTPGNDADPNAYEVATANLSLAGLATGTPVRVRGFVRPFGSAPVDFTAQTLINVAQAPAALLVAWNPASATPFVSSSSTGLTLNLNGVGSLHHVLRGGVATELVGVSPSVQPADALHGIYAIGYQGTVQVYTQFALYQQALVARLGANQQARFFGGVGSYSDVSATLTSTGAFVALQ